MSSSPTPATASSGITTPTASSWAASASRTRRETIPGFLITSHYFPLTLGADGLLYVVNPRALRVEVYTFGGDLERTWGKGSPGIEGFFGCCNPVYLATMGDGRFVTVEKGARRVKIYSPQGKFDCVVAGPEQLSAEPGPVAADGRGRILVLDPVAAVVRVFEEKKSNDGRSPMNQPHEQRQTRRELCASVIRYAALGGITLWSAGLVRRGGKSCRQAIACGQCAKLDGCTLPQAAAAKIVASRRVYPGGIGTRRDKPGGSLGTRTLYGQEHQQVIA